jgi:hypothetical protein
MPRKSLLITLTVVLAASVPCLPNGAAAFELFPRPDGQYTVQRGDTLYGIAGYYYTNPALWPFLWNQNPQVQVKDHTGSPENQPLEAGTKVDLYHSRSPNAVMNQPFVPPTGLPDEVRFMVSKIPFQGIPYDRKYFRFKLSQRPTQLWGYIVDAPEQNRESFLERELVYIRFRPSKKQAILVGDRLGVYRDHGPVNHPLNPDRTVGHFSEVVGEIEIIHTGHELATAIILDSYVELQRGDKVSLFVPRSKEIVPTKTHRLLTGTVLRAASKDTWYMDSNNLEDDVIFIDRGECHGMKEGMLVNIYRPTQPVPDPYFSRRVNLPDTYVGEGMILKAFDKNSTVIITRMRQEIVPGDVVKSVSD